MNSIPPQINFTAEAFHGLEDFDAEREEWRVRQILTDMVEVEREVPGDGTVEAGLKEGSPPRREGMGPALVLLAHTTHSRIPSLVAESRISL